MSSFSDELLNVDRERINVRAGLLGLVVLSVFGVAVAVWGPVFIAAAMGALVLLVTDPPPPGRRWVTALLPLLVAGTAMTFLAVWVGAQPPQPPSWWESWVWWPRSTRATAARQEFEG
jgi:4-hydroxybenzoate polyprenyltransferase